MLSASYSMIDSATRGRGDQLNDSTVYSDSAEDRDSALSYAGTKLVEWFDKGGCIYLPIVHKFVKITRSTFDH